MGTFMETFILITTILSVAATGLGIFVVVYTLLDPGTFEKDDDDSEDGDIGGFTMMTTSI